MLIYLLALQIAGKYKPSTHKHTLKCFINVSTQAIPLVIPLWDERELKTLSTKVLSLVLDDMH
jgi:hypothetical protein